MSDSHSKKIRKKRQRRHRAHQRIRKQIKGTAARPRLAVFKSLQYVYAQLIDDATGKTIAQANSAEVDIKSGLGASAGSCEAAKAVGEAIATRGKEAGVETVVFDRGGFIYHGRIKAVADGARAKGLQF